ncbi:MAG TPA: YggT family protein [Kiloniellales bacterium]
MIVLKPLLQVADIALELYMWLIIVSAVLSWLVAFNVVNTRNQVVFTIGNFLYRITEPALRPIRRFVPNFGGVDVTPVVLILVVLFIRMLLAEIYVSLASASY